MSPDIAAYLEYSTQPDSFDSDRCFVIAHFLGSFNFKQNSLFKRKCKWDRITSDVNSDDLDYRNSIDFSVLASTSLLVSQPTPISMFVIIKKNPPWWANPAGSLVRKENSTCYSRHCSKESWLEHKKSSYKLKREMKASIRNFWDQIYQNCANNKGM